MSTQSTCSTLNFCGFIREVVGKCQGVAIGKDKSSEAVFPRLHLCFHFFPCPPRLSGKPMESSPPAQPEQVGPGGSMGPAGDSQRGATSNLCFKVPKVSRQLQLSWNWPVEDLQHVHSHFLLPFIEFLAKLSN